MSNHKYKIGQKVVYDGLIGEIESTDVTVFGTLVYGLVSVEDPELTCTADESLCEPYTGDYIYQQPRITEVYLSSERIRNIVYSV